VERTTSSYRLALEFEDTGKRWTRGRRRGGVTDDLAAALGSRAGSPTRSPITRAARRGADPFGRRDCRRLEPRFAA
jgi:hypothetical protein